MGLVSRVGRFPTGWHLLGKGPFRTFSSLTTRRVVLHKRFLSSRIYPCIAIYDVHDRERGLSNQREELFPSVLRAANVRPESFALLLQFLDLLVRAGRKF